MVRASVAHPAKWSVEREPYTYDDASGRVRRGPRVLTDNGFEWLARLLLEPRCLWRRYLPGTLSSSCGS